jgi:hypothetical protein
MQTFVTLNPLVVARALGGEASGRNIRAPGPGHSRTDRSLSVTLDPAAPDGFIVNSFSPKDEPMVCRDHVRAALGFGAWQPERRPSRPSVAPRSDDNDRIAYALAIWKQSHDPQGTTVQAFFASRRLSLIDDIAGRVIRYHPSLKFDGRRTGAMVTLFRDIRDDEPRAIHRTFLDSDGRKLDRRMLGPVKDAAIKLDPDEAIECGLHIGEGIETCIAARLAGFRPVGAW